MADSSYISRHLEDVRTSDSYKQLLSAVSKMMTNNANEDSTLASVADTILRTIASDISSMSTQGKIVIMHLGIVPKVEGKRNVVNRSQTSRRMHQRG